MPQEVATYHRERCVWLRFGGGWSGGPTRLNGPSRPRRRVGPRGLQRQVLTSRPLPDVAGVGGLFDGAGNATHDLFVEHAGDDVFLAEFVGGDATGDGFGGGEFHRLGDGGGAG